MKNIFSLRLTELIRESGKTQNKISSEFKITKQKLSNWKVGFTEPNLDDLMMIATYFGVSTDYLLGLEDDAGGKPKTDSKT
ncbi:MAG: helix-turn-helix transcriptional regulator [Clostridia bacterium]|nr:helix-turn-helix transcriptional regulator [Clostridia bacterium]